MKAVKRILIILCLAAIIISAVQLLRIYLDYKEGEQTYTAIADQYIIPVQTQPVIPTLPEDPTTPESEDVTLPPAPPKATAPISVDFKTLQKDFPNVIGWIYCEDTPINYPIMQCKDNEYYLKRLIDGTSNPSGSIFMDYRNASDFSDWNTLIYGHNMNNGSMFGSIYKYRHQSYYDAHPVMYILTPEKDYKLELFAGYITSVKGDIFSFDSSPSDVKRIVTNARGLSAFKSNVEIQDGEKLVTLSTCYTDGYRYVMVGVLREPV